MKINNKDRFDADKFKEELIASHDDSISFKDSKTFSTIKNKLNSMLKEHFDQRTFEKQQHESQKARAKSRFEKKTEKKKKLIALFSDLVLKLGIDSPARELHKKLLLYVSLVNILLSLIIIGFIIANGKSLDILITSMLIIWTLVFGAIYLLTALFIFIYLDIRMHQYVKQIEEDLPDYLQLASANISAGMTIDRALWYAVRPKFGILATEMESVAKATVAGEDLEKALAKLSRKYDSRMLKETMNLIIEGIQSGGQMAQLLDKLSSNIKDTQLMRKEIGASVTTYAIFIGVATVLAAPILFALSTQLLIIIQQIFGSIKMDPSGGPSGMFSFDFSGESISIKNFKRFAILVLVISSFFSAAIISVIRKGSVKDGLKTIPLFMIVSIILYFLASAAFSYLMGGLF